MLAMRKLFLLSVTGVLCLATASQAVNLITNGDFAVNPTSAPATWHVTHTRNMTPDANNYSTYAWNSADGYKTFATDAYGTERLDRGTVGSSSNGMLFYQMIPVTQGRSYYVRGLWKGSLYPGTAGAGKSWTEVYVGFTPDANVGQVYWPNALRYKKSWDGANYDYVNISAGGTWPWEDITASPTGQPPAYYIPQVGQNYMVIAFNLGGLALTGTPQVPYVMIDNVTIVECSQWLAGDTNQDCAVNISDLALVANLWLNCNLTPASACP
jgi:hypothetical protein